MPCICQYIKDRGCKDSVVLMDSSRYQNSESSVRDISTSLVSASEMAFLKAEVWSLKSKVMESSDTIRQLENIVKDLVEEKYHLTEELIEAKNSNFLLSNQCSSERDLQATERKKLINEIVLIKRKLDEKEQLLEKVAKQNIELKLGLQGANETIHNMGVVFLKMKCDRGFRNQEE